MNHLIKNIERNRFPSIFDQFFTDFMQDLGPSKRSYNEALLKPFRSVEKENEYLLSLDLPGVKKEDAHVEVDSGVLTIRAERKDFWATEKGRGESYDKFERSFTLPTSVDVEKIDAQMEDGVLNVVLPKLAASKGRKVAIGSSTNGGFWKKFTGSTSENNE